MASESDELRKLRSKIDNLDDAILGLIADRKGVAIEIARLKKKRGVSDDETRLREVFSRVERRAAELGLDPKRTHSLWESLIAYMQEEQRKNA